MQAEYPATIEEALTVPGGAFFPEVKDDSILTDTPLKGNVVTYFVMDYGLDMLVAYWINRDSFGNAQIVKEHCESNLTIGASWRKRYLICQEIIKWFNGLRPDSWNRSQETGKSRAVIFYENGLNLTKVNNDVAAGCSAMKEYFSHGDAGKSRLTILDNCAPVLLNSLKKYNMIKRKQTYMRMTLTT